MVTLQNAKDHLRLDEDDPMVLAYLAAAQEWVRQYLNRGIYADAVALANAKAGAQSALEAASLKLEADLEAAALVNGQAISGELVDQANANFRAAVQAYRELSGSMVGNEAIDAATLLVLGDLYENREGSFVGVSYEPNPTVMNLLNPYRIGMGV